MSEEDISESVSRDLKQGRHARNLALTFFQSIRRSGECAQNNPILTITIAKLLFAANVIIVLNQRGCFVREKLRINAKTIPKTTTLVTTR